jgi:hypothetical protein
LAAKPGKTAVGRISATRVSRRLEACLDAKVRRITLSLIRPTR